MFCFHLFSKRLFAPLSIVSDIVSISNKLRTYENAWTTFIEYVIVCAGNKLQHTCQFVTTAYWEYNTKFALLVIVSVQHAYALPYSENQSVAGLKVL